MKRVLLALLLTVPIASRALAAEAGDITGRWEVTTTFAGGSSTAGLELTRAGETYTGKSGWLVPDWAPFQYTGQREAKGVRLTVTYGGTDKIGEFLVRNERGTLKGAGTLHDIPVTITGKRPRDPPAGGPRVHDFVPQVFYRRIDGTIPPALRVFPGDTIRTETVDAVGLDSKDKARSFSGNPATGPFYIEGAMPGDTLVVRFNKIRPNRRWAMQARAALLPSVLQPGHPQSLTEGWSDRWTLDLDKNTATPDAPGEKLKNVSIALEPMLGVVGVAPFWDQVSATADLGRWGGNLDYNQIRDGTTIYFAVYQAGALLFIGDGHARQGDGELTGQGLEISMDVDFTVDVIHGEYLDQPWLENSEYIMVSGVDGTLTSAFQAANSGLSKWLASHYKLNTSEIATLLANSVEYDIAEAVDPHMHVVAKIRKDVLSQIPKP